ncbi:hypothetical protein GCM10022225_02950 [Plantactinospora mayteni]|uniref:Uncharacterized protein n=1 Tax=Plantactinospora mayteni TaxID=566021 RepID=A0ABQ4EQ62_9ACTN|nr:hypothetical protein [Plantactinospora mayteni]GIG96783.1 hypothetical protein Pma05_33560 [Plantactinospora mayteni]
MDIRQVRATINQGEQAAKQGISLIQEMQARIEQAQTSAAATAHDSAHREVEAGLGKLKEAVKESSRVAGLLHSGASAAHEYASKL